VFLVGCELEGRTVTEGETSSLSGDPCTTCTCMVISFIFVSVAANRHVPVIFGHEVEPPSECFWKEGIAPGRRNDMPPPMAVRRWPKSWRIYVRPRTVPQSAHLWWPAMAKLQAASMPILRQLRHGTERRAYRAIPKCPLGRGAW